jgi:hypothetical protein
MTVDNQAVEERVVLSAFTLEQMAQIKLWAVMEATEMASTEPEGGRPEGWHYNRALAALLSSSVLVLEAYGKTLTRDDRPSREMEALRGSTLSMMAGIGIIDSGETKGLEIPNP